MPKTSRRRRRPLLQRYVFYQIKVREDFSSSPHSCLPACLPACLSLRTPIAAYAHKVAKDNAAAAEADAEEEAAANALRENIAKKGKNAYYYAHAHNAAGPKWDGDPTPRLLEKKPSTAADDGSGGDVVKPIKKYQWADETSKVKVYVPFGDNGITGKPLAEGGAEVTSTTDSVTLDVRTDDASRVTWQLSLAKLYDDIDGAKARVKSDKIILILNKPADKAFSWHDLKKSP